jgi:hypothetical protein
LFATRHLSSGAQFDGNIEEEKRGANRKEAYPNAVKANKRKALFPFCNKLYVYFHRVFFVMLYIPT